MCSPPQWDTQRDFAGEERISQQEKRWPPWLPRRELLTAAELPSSTSSINTNTLMALTAGQILITLFFPLRFYNPSGQYFSSWIIDLLIIHVPKILILRTWQTLSVLSQLSDFLSSLSQGCAASTYQRWAVDAWNMDSWRSPHQFVTERATDRGAYIKENHHHHGTNLYIPVFTSASRNSK